MKYLVSGQEMRLLDTNTTERFGVPAQMLMEQAAMVFVEKLLSYGHAPDKVLVICGWGNNGGDGLAIARLLNQKGKRAVIYCLPHEEEAESELFRLQKKIYNAYVYPEAEQLPENREFDCVVDAVFGVGLSREVAGETAKILKRINGMQGWKVAVDMPSGISADNGAVLGVAFQADDTFTFSFEKLGQHIFPGADYSGRVTVLPIGITAESFLGETPKVSVFEREELNLLPRRVDCSHKGTYGRLLVVAGSPGMAGAAYLAAEAAYRMGTGLVKIFTAKENVPILQNLVPETILAVSGKNPDRAQLTQALKWADAVAIGPGLGTSRWAADLMEAVVSLSDIPMVVDADGLNLLARDPELLHSVTGEVVLTPHLGEMARLVAKTTSEVSEGLVETARAFAKQQGVACVLKNAHTVTALPDGSTFLNLSGNNGMATAGSGDVLCGVIGALLAQGLSASLAAPLGVYVHGFAGDAAKKIVGARSMMARDILDGIKEVPMV